MKRVGLAIIAAVASAVFALSGCSAAAKLTNTGGDTTCKDFSGQDSEKQDSEVTKMLKDKDGEEPAKMKVSATRMAVELYCKTIGKDSSKISEALG